MFNELNINRLKLSLHSVSNTTKIRDIRGLSKAEIKQFLVEELQQPAYRADQVWQWLWQKGATHFDQMTDLPKSVRTALGTQLDLLPIALDQVQSSKDGTIKSRFRLHDGHLIESVLIPVPADHRFTVCVSSQVGCSLSCTFCATGKMKRIRNLDAGEIYDQVNMVNEQCVAEYGRRLTNIVFMGMGEPLLAYKNVMDAIQRITAPDGLGISPKRITVSTAGIAKMIERLADDQIKFNLALSLHAADDDKRSEIMPINEQNNLSRLKEALIYFQLNTRNKLTLEYIALQNFNDHVSDAVNLANFCRDLSVIVNIIEYNPIEGFAGTTSDPQRLDKFVKTLTRHGVSVTVRRSRGKDIDAACGQLANKD